MNKMRVKSIVAALGLTFSGLAGAAIPISFDADRQGSAPAASVATCDWLPGTAVAVKGNPASTGLVLGSQFQLLSHAKLGTLIDINGNTVFYGLNTLPPGVEITFVAGIPER